MSIKRGDIYWIAQSQYRYTVGSVQQPGRPGIVVSNDTNNACSRTIEIVYLTGQPKTKLPTHCTINSTGRTSTALCEQISTVSTEQVRERCGHCTAEEMAEVERCIAISLGLPDPMEDFYKAIREAGTIQPGDEIADPLAKIHNLELENARLTAALNLLKPMYDNLLVLAMGQE